MNFKKMRKVQKRRTFTVALSWHMAPFAESQIFDAGTMPWVAQCCRCFRAPCAADAAKCRARKSRRLAPADLTLCFVPKRESIRADVLRRPRTHDGGSLHRHRRRRQRHIAWLETRMYTAPLPLPTVAVFAPRSPPPPSASAHRLHIGVGVAMRQLARRSQERKYPNRPAPPCIQCVSLQYSWRTSLATALGAAVAFPAQPYALLAWFVVPCVATE